MKCLDTALLKGQDATLEHYEPVIHNIAKSHATQDRATLNHDDLKQVGRLEVMKCFRKLSKDSDIRNFDSFVKGSIRMGVIGEIGKEFCLKRGRFPMAEFTEVYEEEQSTATTPAQAEEAYKNYHENLNQDFTLSTLIKDVLAIVPKKYHPVLQALLQREYGHIKVRSQAKLATLCKIPVKEFESAVTAIQEIARAHHEELFNPKYRAV